MFQLVISINVEMQKEKKSVGKVGTRKHTNGLKVMKWSNHVTKFSTIQNIFLKIQKIEQTIKNICNLVLMKILQKISQLTIIVSYIIQFYFIKKTFFEIFTKKKAIDVLYCRFKCFINFQKDILWMKKVHLQE